MRNIRATSAKLDGFILNPSLQSSESNTEENVERLCESEVMEDSKEIKYLQSYQGLYTYELTVCDCTKMVFVDSYLTKTQHGAWKIKPKCSPLSKELFAPDTL